MVTLSGTLNVLVYGYNTLFYRITCKNCSFECINEETDEENLSYFEEIENENSIFTSFFLYNLLDFSR